MPTSGRSVSDEALAILSKDPVLSGIITQIGPLPDLELGDPWWELVDSIVSQQLSVKASATILSRVEALFEHWPTPQDLVGIDPEKLRGAGLSWAKVRYVQDLGQKVLDKELKLSELAKLPDEEIIEELTKVKGIGRWTAEMFLIFHLGREDVWPVDDLGVQEAVKRAYTHEKRLDKTALTELAEPWRPYRSIAARYLWKSLDNTPLSSVEQN